MHFLITIDFEPLVWQCYMAETNHRRTTRVNVFLAEMGKRSYFIRGSWDLSYNAAFNSAPFCLPNSNWNRQIIKNNNSTKSNREYLFPLRSKPLQRTQLLVSLRMKG